MQINKTNKAFTLVELIVVITILAILGTIAFLSLQGYSKSARDGVRMADISSIKESLELFSLKVGQYPDPENSFPVTYSGAVIRNQGIFGAQNLINVGNINKLPKDPLYDKEYTYSLLNTKNEYELGSILESQTLAKNVITNIYAANTNNLINYIKGTYNGSEAKVIVGDKLYILGIASIINGQIGTKNIYDLFSGGLISHNTNDVIPGSYNLSNSESNPGIIVNTGSLVIYSGLTF